MKRKYVTSAGITVLIAGILVVIFAVSGGSAKNRHSLAASGSAVNVQSTSLGKTVVDANGRTLYLFEGDKANVSTLSSAGLAVWPPFTAKGPVKAEGGAHAAKIGTITGPNGTMQVTYNSHPLYYYVGDSKPGDTHGQRLNQFGALWYVLAPNGNAITSTSTNSQPTQAAPSSGYGY